MSNTTSGLSRRTLAKGAAWSVPVIAVAGKANAYQSSPPDEEVPPVVDLQLSDGVACKWPGASAGDIFKGYRLSGKITNSGDVPMTVTLLGIVDGQRNEEPIVWQAAGFRVGGATVSTITLKRGETIPLWLIINNEADSGTSTISGTVRYSFQPVGGEGAAEVATERFDAEAKDGCKKHNLDF